MARTTAALGLASLFLGAARAQMPGEATEVHPELTTYRCSLADGCKEETNYVVLDSLAHPVHQADNSFNCGNWGEPANATACPDQESCAKNCIMEGVDDYSAYGITTDGSALRLQQILDGRVVSPRVYLLDSTEHKYEMLSLTGNEFAFDVDATKLPCGMNSALYLSEMEPTGAESELNPGGAYYGTGYCDAQCYVTPFINGLVCSSVDVIPETNNIGTNYSSRAILTARARAATRWTSGRPTAGPTTLPPTRAASTARTSARAPSVRWTACATRTAARGTRTAST